MSSGVTTPMAIARAVWASGPHAPRRFRVTGWMQLVGFVGLVAGIVLLMKMFPALAHVGSSANGGRLGAIIVFTPVLIVAGIAYALVRGWHERATQPFDFPMVVVLPGWGVWSVSADMLVLVKQRSTICLIRREPAVLASVLEAIDPDHVLEVIEDDVESPTRIEVELPGEQPLSGQFRMLGEGGYLLMLGPDRDAELLADIDATYLPRTRPRAFGEKPQKFRPLASVAVAMARLVR